MEMVKQSSLLSSVVFEFFNDELFDRYGVFWMKEVRKGINKKAFREQLNAFTLFN
jgi:cytochrome b subunit of formate dehydrogenase